MDALAGAIDELHFDLSKIMLTELPGQTFETNQRLGRLRAERGDQRVEGSLASLIACFPDIPDLWHPHLFRDESERAVPRRRSWKRGPNEGCRTGDPS